MNKSEMHRRLKPVGLWPLAEYMIRKDDWNDAWEILEPLVNTIERMQRDISAATHHHQRQFIGYKGDVADLLDPQYKQKDSVQQVIDAYIWLSEQFRLIVTDTAYGTTIDFDRATQPPPTVFAIQLLEEYARAEPGTPQRKAMADKVQSAIAKQANKPDKTNKKRRGIGYVGDDL